MPNSSITNSKGASAARQRATSSKAAGEGPVRRGSLEAASARAFRSELAALKDRAGGIVPKLRKTALCSARKIVKVSGSRSAVTRPR
ncbi:MAG: hypothetical protein OXE04_07020 [bacterium]|nr:hypothetical protein [bacterium]